MERDDLHHDPDEELEEYDDYREYEEDNSLQEEFDAEPLRLVDKLLSLAPEKDPARPLLYGLRRQLMEREITFQEARRSLVELEAALEKVTSPSNRVGIYLGSPRDEIATVFVGGAEYYANIDPRVDVADLEVGTRILINEAYAVVGVLGFNPAGPIAKIGDLFDDGRLRLTQEHGSQDLVVERSASLADADLKKGDEVRVDPGFKVALERIAAGDGKEYFLENVPVMDWSSIGGQEEAIQAIRDTIELPALHPELFERFQYSTPKGFLLYGPPGCGKTLIGKATAYNLVRHIREEEGEDVKEYFMHIKGPEILNMWLGETERMVREIFCPGSGEAEGGVSTLRLHRRGGVDSRHPALHEVAPHRQHRGAHVLHRNGRHRVAPRCRDHSRVQPPRPDRSRHSAAGPYRPQDQGGASGQGGVKGDF